MIDSPVINIDEKLSVNRFHVDEQNAHILLKDEPEITDFEKLVQCCPAALYKRDAGGQISFDYAGCLECGACRILGADTVLKKWEYPQNAKGVSYRYG